MWKFFRAFIFVSMVGGGTVAIRDNVVLVVAVAILLSLIPHWIETGHRFRSG